jgi:phosphoribosylamine--glycine ligase
MFVIGGGGREHALVWHLAYTDPNASIYCAPGNAGIASLATCLPVSQQDLPGLAGAAASIEADLTVVGPEAPLVAGVVDVFAARGLAVFGPTAAAARLEGSKTFAKDLMRRHGVPTADYRVFDDPVAAAAYARGLPGGAVVKADGLTAGKGVIVCTDPEESARAVQTVMVDRAFGDAGRRVVIEERLEGAEVSVFALVHGEATCVLPPAQDHKRVFDGDRGANTGGMGAVAPYPLLPALLERVRREIIEPIAHGMCAEGSPYRGVLFAGLMLTRDGPRVLEFNCRFGDPEAQVLMPLLAAGLPEMFDGVWSGRAASWDATAAATKATAGVVLASRGYPEKPETGFEIHGLDAAAAHGDVLVFHNGTAARDNRTVTAGGRVLTVVGRGPDAPSARSTAYDAVNRITFDGMHYRRDIGGRAPYAAVGGV